MATEKQVFMRMDDEVEDSNTKEFIKHQPQDMIIDELTDNIDISIVDGMAQISMPEPFLKVLLSAFKQLEKALDKGIQR